MCSLQVRWAQSENNRRGRLVQLAPQYGKNLSSAFWQQQIVRTGSSRVWHQSSIFIHYVRHSSALIESQKHPYFHLLFTAVNRSFPLSKPEYFQSGSLMLVHSDTAESKIWSRIMGMGGWQQAGLHWTTLLAYSVC